MRIITGNFKGKKLFEPIDKETRPLKDLTKESIFNIINHSNKFSVNIISHTENNTTWKDIKIGDDINTEIDIFARYISRQIEEG